MIYKCVGFMLGLLLLSQSDESEHNHHPHIHAHQAIKVLRTERKNHDVWHRHPFLH